MNTEAIMSMKIDEAALRRVVGGVCGRDLAGVPADADLVRELGLDSLARLRVLAAVEKHFGVRFEDSRLGAIRTVGQLMVEAERAGKEEA